MHTYKHTYGQICVYMQLYICACRDEPPPPPVAPSRLPPASAIAPATLAGATLPRKHIHVNIYIN